MNKISLSLFLFIAIMHGLCGSAIAYSLNEALEKGLTTNLTIKAQELSIQEAELGKKHAYGNFLPTISFTRQSTKLSNGDDSEVSNNNDYLDQHRIFESMRLSQPLFTGYFGVNSIVKADYLLKFQKAELENAKVRLVYDIRRQFIQYLKLQDDAARIMNSIQRLEKQLSAAQAFYDRQMAPKLHVMQAEVALAKAQQSLVQITTQRENARVTLNQLLALDVEQPINYTGSLVEMDYEFHKTVEEYQREAKLRPDVEEARLNVEISKREKLLIMSQNFPKISLDASYNRSDTDYDISDSQDENIYYWSTVVNFSMQLFHGGQTITSSLKQDVVTKRYQKNLEELLSKIQMNVHSSYSSMVEARQRIDSATSIKEAALRSYERAENRYRTGMGTSVDVLNAQDDVSIAEADIVQARADFQTAKGALDYVAGIRATVQ